MRVNAEIKEREKKSHFLNDRMREYSKIAKSQIKEG